MGRSYTKKVWPEIFALEHQKLREGHLPGQKKAAILTTIPPALIPRKTNR